MHLSALYIQDNEKGNRSICPPNQEVVEEYLVLCKMVITHFSYVFVVLSVLTGVRVTAVINTVNNDSQSAAICCDKPSVVCNCNINTDQPSSNVSEAIEALERKVDHLISLVSNSSTSSPEPTNPPGKPH